ncbi:hypothetical protein HAX54_008699, partial [Datura stramonium]|nr:hypothetical protein [Datura stramonium]
HGNALVLPHASTNVALLHMMHRIPIEVLENRSTSMVNERQSASNLVVDIWAWSLERFHISPGYAWMTCFSVKSNIILLHFLRLEPNLCGIGVPRCLACMRVRGNRDDAANE